MEKEFSTYWIGSKQPRKQRKYLAKAPNHIKARIMSSALSKELRARHKMRSVQIRKGDNVKVIVGSFKKKTGKVAIVDRSKMKVTIEGLQKTKKEGSKVNIWFHPSNLQVIELNLDDKRRMEKTHKENNQMKIEKVEKTEKKESKTQNKVTKKETKHAP